MRTVEAADEVATERLPSARPAVLMALAQIHLLAGELAEAEARLAECDVELLPEAARTQASLSVPLVEGGIALARADHDRAIEEADALVDRLDHADLLIYRPEALLLKGRALAAAGRTSEAEGTLREARSKAERLGSWPSWVTSLTARSARRSSQRRGTSSRRWRGRWKRS